MSDNFDFTQVDVIRRPRRQNKAGRIHLRGHGHDIYWRNIRIKELP